MKKHILIIKINIKKNIVIFINKKICFILDIKYVYMNSVYCEHHLEL